MARRKPGREWTAVGLPHLRDRLVQSDRDQARTQQIEAEQVRAIWGQAPESIRAAVRTYEEAAPKQVYDIGQLADAELYWVAPAMVEVTRRAAVSLPEWTPATALPAPSGLMCWATPLLTDVPAPDPGGGRATWVTWDAAFWRPLHGRPGWVEVDIMTRDGDSPLRPVLTLMLGDPERIRDPRAEDDQHAEVLLSAVGAAWLLMGLPRMADTRIQRSGSGRVESSGGHPPQVRDVTIIDLRRSDHPPSERDQHPGREWTHRWWVDGHWRQQACGPGHSQRKPVWIAPHVKGPEGLPMADSPRVHVWRR